MATAKKTVKVEAKIRYVHMAPQKVRRVAALVRRLPVVQAEQLLENLPKRASVPIWKAIHSAASNAVHNSGMDRNQLIVEAITVGESLTLPRFMPRAQGRAYKIRKRFSHIYVTVSQPEGTTKKKSDSKKTTTAAKPKVEKAAKPATPVRAKAVIKDTKIK